MISSNRGFKSRNKLGENIKMLTKAAKSLTGREESQERNEFRERWIIMENSGNNYMYKMQSCVHELLTYTSRGVMH